MNKSDLENARIFVQIASYRDPECQWTIKDLFEKASFPERVFVGVCWQWVPEEDQDCFIVETRPDQVRVSLHHAKDSLGVAWARNIVQRLWQGEEYTLQIDSHMRFLPGWDVEFLNVLGQCSSDQPVISNYPPGYTPPNQLIYSLPSIMVADRFTPTGILLMKATSQPWRSNNGPQAPVVNAFCSGGCIFSSSKIIKDVPYDPHLYFFGEEITMAVRLWTKNWDMFCPHKVLIWHNWDRSGRPTHRADHGDYAKFLHRKSLVRLRHVLGIQASSDPIILTELDIYGLGNMRSLEQYEEFSGINFSRQTISQKAYTGSF